MIHPRLSIAIAQGGLPESGDILVLRPLPDSDLAGLPRDRSVLIQGFRPDHDALAARGWTVRPEPDETGTCSGAVVFVPRSRKEAMALIALAAARVVPGGPVWVDGQKTDGIEAVLRDLRARVTLSDAFSKSHGKCAMFPAPGPGALTDWQARATMPAPGFVAVPGCFSAEGVDPGSALLAAHLPHDLKGRVADLGAGWGWLSAQVLQHAPKVTAMILVEAEHAALQSARANLSDARAEFLWADATSISGLPRIGTVVMNPPFHRGRTGDPGLGADFIRAAARILSPDGVLWMVANRHLPYEPVLTAAFGQVSEVAGSAAFKVYRAARPTRVTPGIAPGRPQAAARRGG